MNRMARRLATLRYAAAACSAATLLALACGPARAAEIRVFTSGAPAEVQKVVARTFSAATGDRVLLTVANIAAIQERLSGPETPDVVILPAPQF